MNQDSPVTGEKTAGRGRLAEGWIYRRTQADRRAESRRSTSLHRSRACLRQPASQRHATLPERSRSCARRRDTLGPGGSRSTLRGPQFPHACRPTWTRQRTRAQESGRQRSIRGRETPSCAAADGPIANARFRRGRWRSAAKQDLGVLPLSCPTLPCPHTYEQPILWRRGWDSNPRLSFPNTRFPSVLLKPLGHLSAWLAGLDSNQDSRLQRPMCYRLHHPPAGFP